MADDAPKGSYPHPGDPNNEMPPELRAWADQYLAWRRDNPRLAAERDIERHRAIQRDIDHYLAAQHDNATAQYSAWTPPPTHDHNDAARDARSN